MGIYENIKKVQRLVSPYKYMAYNQVIGNRRDSLRVKI